LFFVILFSMLKRIILFIISFLLMVFGCTFIFVYINLFSFGYTILDYLKFIFSRVECLCFFVGLILYVILIIKKRS